MLSPPHAAFLEQFKLASGEGAVVELKLRLLADKIPALQRFAHAQKLEDIEDEIAKYFGHALSQAEKDILALCRKLRNKILHCNFGAARERLTDLGAEPQSPGVRRIDLSGMDTNGIYAKVEQAIVHSQGTFVSASPTTQPGGVFGWLLEAGAAGDFQNAVSAFHKAAAIVDRLANRCGTGA